MDHCETCAHHAGEPDPKGRRECRAQPPTLGQEVRLPNGRNGFIGIWPLTLAADGCGGHRARGEMPPLAGPADEPGDDPAHDRARPDPESRSIEPRPRGKKGR